MKKSKFSEDQIAFALKQAELGTSVDEVCRKMGISEATFYLWRKKYQNLGPSELRRLRQLEEENRKLKQLVADRGERSDLGFEKSFVVHVARFRRHNTTDFVFSGPRTRVSDPDFALSGAAGATIPSSPTTAVAPSTDSTARTA